MTNSASDLAPSRRTTTHLSTLAIAAITIGVVSGIAALGLSIYNAVRFDDRVHDYVVSHAAELRVVGARGPRGFQGPSGEQGPQGPQGDGGTWHTLDMPPPGEPPEWDE